MKRYQKFLFYMLIGLLVAPLSSMAFFTNSGNQILNVHVNLVPLNIIADQGNSQLNVGSYDPPTPATQWHSYADDANYAEFRVEGARGYWFSYNINYHVTDLVNGIVDSYLPGSTKGVHITSFRLTGASEMTYTGGNGFTDIPNNGTAYTGAAYNPSAKLGVSVQPGKYWLRVTISKLWIDVGAKHGDYYFPVTITVAYLPGY